MTESTRTPTDDIGTAQARSLRPFPLTSAQRGIWFAQQLVPETPIAIANYVEIRGPLDVDLLEELGRELSHEFPSTMLRLVEIDGEPHQIVDRSLDNLIRRMDFRDRPDPVSAAQNWMLADYAAPRDMFADRLGSVVVLRLGDDHYFWYSCAHHIALDGYGAILMLSRTAERYTALVRGETIEQVRLADLTEINDAEAAYLASTRIEKDREHWFAKAADLPAPVTLAVRAGEMDSRSRVIGGLLPTPLAETLRTAAAHLDTADTVITIAALAAFLARVTDTGDLVLSLPVSARTTAVLRRSGGMVSNVVPLRFSITGTTTLRDLVRMVQLELTGALRHQRYRAEDLRRDINAGTARGFYGPAINIMNFPSDITLGDVTGRFNILSTGPVEDLSVNIYPSEDGSSRVDFEANPNRYTDSELCTHYERFLATFAALLDADPDSPISDIDVLSTGEREALVPASGGTGPRPVLLVDALRAGVAANPDGVALVAGDRSLTYRELDATSSRLARALIVRGVGPETFVAVAFSRSIDVIVAIWAIAKTGAAFVPVDPNHPVERITHMLTDSATVLGITTSATASKLPATAEWLCLDTLDTTRYTAAPITDADRTTPLRPEHPAYLIYTSGSTGLPKGVVVTHTGLGNFTAAARPEFSATTASRLLRFSSASFDASVFEMMLAFSAGGALVIADPAIYGGAELTELLARERVTHTVTAPAILSTVDAHALPDLHNVVVGGDVCPPDLVARFGSGAHFHNSYGPTETTIITTLSAALTDPAAITLGTLLPGVHALVLDSRLRPVAPGAFGELYLGGPQVARGYHHRFALTATRFIADPSHPGERLYRTGDLVRWELTDDSPVLHYLGRTDAQVQLNGVRIEPGEVDATLTTHPSVDFALTLVRRNALVSYIHTTPGRTHDSAALLAHARTHLPAHLVPTHILDLPDVPLTPNGKVDLRVLPEPVWTAKEYLAPASSDEELVAALFADVTGTERVGRDDDFFALGGNSLSATRVVGALRRDAGVRVGVRALFEAPTVARFAAVVAAAERATGPVLEPRQRPDRVPLSTAQSRMWFLNRFDPDAATYTIPVVVRLSGELDIPALKAAVDDVVTRHESLRTVFPDDGDGPVQIVLPPERCGVELQVLDPGPVPDRLAQLLGQGFDVTAAVPVRAALLPVDTDWLLVIAVHHISADGVSTGPLARDVFSAYVARRAGGAPKWSPLPVQYADFALWQRDVLGDDSDPASTAARQLTYWRERLVGAPEVIELPTDRPRPPIASYRGAAVDIQIDPSVIKRARALAAERGVSVFMLTHAVFAVLLSRLGAGADVVIGTPVAGRGDPALDDLVGMFVNTVALRTAVDPAASFASILDNVRETDLDAFAHTEIPFERLVDALDPIRSQAHSPLFQVAFAYDHAQPDMLALPALTVTVESFEPGIAQFDLALTLTETDSAVLNQADPAAVTATLRYASDLFDHATAETLLNRYLLLLDTLTAAPDSTVGGVRVLAESEWALLVPAHGPAAAPVATWPDLIHTAATTAPETAAVVWQDREYSYRELDERSNALARILLARGAGPEVRVAVAAARSVESVLAVWAVTKTGAAFVPIDPDYPGERIGHMLTDSGAVLGLTTSNTTLPHSDIAWLTIDTLHTSSESTAPITDTERPVPLRPEHPAYLIYTSGSTGKPKGVTLTHTGLANLAAERRTRYLLDGTSRFLHNTSPSFDMAIGEQISALSTAATLVITPAGLAGEALTDFLTTHRVSHALITPAVLATLQPTHLPDLKVLGVGGEAVSTDLVDTWAPGRSMRNGYGPTEATDIATVADLAEHQPVTIGHPVHGFTALVLDQHLQPVPPGVPGELYLSGPALARGYHQQPALTATRFLANPHQPGTRMYRTGDLTTWHTTSTKPELRYHGRTDHQIKIRGNRIEPGEIESAARQLDAVTDAAVVAHETPRGRRLAAYLVPTVGHTIELDTVRSYLAANLSAAMLPDAYVILDRLPIAHTGKLNRKSLPEPKFVTAAAEYRAPRTPAEQTLATLFAELLNTDRIGVDDSFFSLGGDSIGAIQLVSRAKTHGLAFSPREVFEHKTVAALAKIGDRADAQILLDELPGGGIGRFPLTPVMRLVTDRPGGINRYAQTMALRLPAGIDRTGLIETLAAVIDHHDTLRARFDAAAREIEIREQGTVDPDALLEHLVIAPGTNEAELRALSERELDAALGRLDPAAGIMLQFVWLAAESGDRLLVVAHHLVVDGVSWRILLPDLITAWSQCLGDAPVQLQPVGTSMRRWAHALPEAARDRSAELAHWVTTLAGPDPLLGTRPLDSEIDTAGTVEIVRLRLDSESTQTLLTKLPAAYRTGTADGLISALSMAVQRWRAARGHDPASVLLQLEGHGREEVLAPGADLSRTVGWFTSVYPIRIDLGDASGVDAALKSVKEQLRAVPDHGAGFGLLRYLDPETADVLGKFAAPQISFNYHGRVDGLHLPEGVAELGWLPDPTLADLHAAPDMDMPAAATIDINSLVTDVDGAPCFSATLSYPGGLLDSASVSELAEHWRTALVEIAEHCTSDAAGGLTPSDVPLVAVAQAELDQWHDARPELVDVWPLSPLQQGLAFHAQVAGEYADVYTTQTVLNLDGTVDANRLRSAVAALVQRHAALRTAFVHNASGESVALVLDAVETPWQASAVTEAEEFDRIRRAEMRERFDLTAAPLVRFHLVTLEPLNHRLIVTLHHIIVDGWSMPLLLQDLLYLYASRGDASALPAAPSYRGFLEWLSTRDRAESSAVWRDALAGIENPTLVARDTIARAGAKAEVDVATTSELTAELAALGARLDVTTNTLVQAAWGILLSRVTCGDDIIYGTTVSGRPADLADVEAMVGLFINTVPVPVRLDNAETVEALLTRLQREQSALLDHHHLGLTEIQSAAGIPVEFDTLVVFESFPVDPAALERASAIDGMRIAGLSGTSITHYPLTLTVVASDTVHFTLKYDESAFETGFVPALAARLLRLLEHFAATPDRPVGGLGVLAESEWALLVPAHGPAAAPVATWPDLIHTAATTAPETAAVVWQDREYSYRELDERSNALARILLARGAGPEVRVAVAAARSVESVLAVWAVTKTGAAFVPIDPDYPGERIGHMLTDSGAVLGLTTSNTTLPHSDIAWLTIDTLHTSSESTAPITDTERPVPLRPEHPAYLIYTSGSTGKPKGVTLTHTGLANLAAERRTRYLLDGTSRFLHNTSPSFDMAIGEQISALSTAATLVITPAGLAGEALTDFLTTHRVSHALITPAVLATLQPTHLPDLKVLGVGGEAVSTDLVDTWAPGRSMRNGYGPTEATDIATVADLAEHQPVTIGHPVHGFTALVLDQHLQPVPPGVPGELYLSGPALARGYHQQPALTATRFLANPHQPGTRMYRTGDLTTWHTTSTKPELRYHGRTDHQIKIRGNRIEPGEINSAFMSHPDVAHAHTRAHATPRGDRALVTYLVPTETTIDKGAVRAHAAAFLPRHLVPTVVMAIAALPLTRSGKVDEKELPAPDFSAATTYRAPSTEHERLVADLFAAILGAETVGADDNFFDLGGNSLSATRLLSRLRGHSDTLSLPALLVDPTPASIAERMASGANTAAEAALDVLLPIQSQGTRPPLFAIHPIVGLSWCYGGLTRYLDGDRPVYGLQTPGILDDAAPAESLVSLAARYLAEIRRIQPTGPYHLLGWSLGGVIAHAIAVQLEDAGETVGSLVLLDSFARPIEPATGVKELQAADLLAGLGVEGSLRGKQTLGPDSVDSVLAEVEDLFPAVRPEHVHRLIAAAAHNSNLLHRHTPRVFGGSALYFTADRDNSGSRKGLDSWAALVAGSVREHRVDATHWEMCAPRALDEIGPVVADYLDRNESAVSQS